MKKIKLAFDISENYINIARISGRGIEVSTEQMPDNLVKDGVVQLPHMMSEFLKELKKEYKLPNVECGIVVPDELTICRTMVLPAMTEKQLMVNLPFEFSDYISNSPQNYVYDYALQEMMYDDEGKPSKMLVTGAVMSKDSVKNYVDIFKNAGMRLTTLIPQEIAVSNIMYRAVESGRAQKDEEYCIVKMGYKGTQIYMYKGSTIQVYRNIHMGIINVDEAISEHEEVDVFMARVYRVSNYNDILNEEYVRNVISRISVEVMKVINFYRYNNRDSELENFYFVGEGALINELSSYISDTSDYSYKSIQTLLPNSITSDSDISGIYSIGVLLQ